MFVLGNLPIKKYVNLLAAAVSGPIISPFEGRVRPRFPHRKIAQCSVNL